MHFIFEKKKIFRKEQSKMKLRKNLLIVTMIATLALLMPATYVMAGAGPEPPATATILPTQVWGVVTMYCTPAPEGLVIIRVKRINDCDVDTQLIVDSQWTFGCPEDDSAGTAESKPLGWTLPAGSLQFFDLPGNPYINKVKNFEQEIDATAGTNATSFEAQFGFWEPATP